MARRGNTGVGNMRTTRTWTTIGLLDHIQNVDRRMEERAFAFVIGEQSSRQAGMPGNAELALRWLEELQRRLDPDYGQRPLEQWATVENLDIPGFELERAGAFYREIFQRRFQDDPDEGLAYLDDLAETCQPTLGHLALAQLLDRTRHRIAITTNRDDLIASAMAIYARRYPKVVTPRELARLARPRLRHPLLARIGRDPLPDENATEESGWAQPLYRLFDHYTPIVIGYDGDDTGTADLLARIEPCDSNGGIFWCYLKSQGQPGGAVEELVEKRRGKFVPIDSFDDFMTRLTERFGLPPVVDEIERHARDVCQRLRGGQAAGARERTVREAQGTARPRKEPEGSDSEAEPVAITTPAAPATEGAPVARLKVVPTAVAAAPAGTPLPQRESEPDWQGWLRRIEQATSDDEREALYREALSQGADATLCGNYAHFMQTRRREPEKAEALYRQALKLDENHRLNIGRFANFMAYVRKSYDMAERLFRRAIDLAPKEGTPHLEYAAYLIVINNLPKALEYTKRAWQFEQNRRTPVAARAAFFRALIHMATRTDPGPALGRLKTLLRDDVADRQWDPEPVLAAMKYKLVADKHALIDTLAALLRGEGNLATLNRFPEWKNAQPIPLTQPWKN